MTIRDMIEQFTIQGVLHVKTMVDDDAITLWKNEAADELVGIPESLEPYVDTPILYMYPSIFEIVVEIENKEVA